MKKLNQIYFIICSVIYTSLVFILPVFADDDLVAKATTKTSTLSTQIQKFVTVGLTIWLVLGIFHWALHRNGFIAKIGIPIIGLILLGAVKLIVSFGTGFIS